MHQVAEAAKLITTRAEPNAKIIFGAVIDKDIKDEVRVTVVATGFDDRPRALAGALGRIERVSAGNMLYPRESEPVKDLRKNSNGKMPLRHLFGNRLEKMAAASEVSEAEPRDDRRADLVAAEEVSRSAEVMVYCIRFDEWLTVKSLPKLLSSQRSTSP